LGFSNTCLSLFPAFDSSLITQNSSLHSTSAVSLRRFEWFCLLSNTRIELTPLTRDGLLILACVVGHALYLLVTFGAGMFRFGFRWIDAWIFISLRHRNLATSGQWAFGARCAQHRPRHRPVELLICLPTCSASTRSGGHNWLGLLFLLIAGVSGRSKTVPKKDTLGKSLVVGLAIALEWHLVWSARLR